MPTRTISTEIVLAGEQKFNDAMKGLNGNLKNLRTDMAVLSAEFDGNAESMEALMAKEKLLGESVAQHKAKVDALRQMYERQKKVYGENSSAADKYKQQLNQATVALLKEQSALDKTVSAIKEKYRAQAAAQAATQTAAAAQAAEAKAAEEAAKAKKQYIPITQKAATAATQAGGKIKQAGSAVKEAADKIVKAAHHVPVIGEAMDIASASAKGFSFAAKGVGVAAKGVGVAASGVGKAAVAFTKLSAAALTAGAAVGTTALIGIANFAKEAAGAAKAAQEAGEPLTASQQKWLEYSGQLDSLNASVSSAKSALAGVLLPVLSDLSTEGAAFLNDFSRDMEAAAGDTGKQGQVLSDYIVKGATLIKQKLPEYIALGKDLFGGLAEGLSESGDEILDMGIDLVMDLLDGIIEYAPELAQAGITLVQKLTESLIEQGPELTTSAVDMVTQIVLGLAQAAPDMIPAAGQLVTQLILALIAAAPELLLAGLELVYGIISGLTDGLGDIIGSADAIITTIISAFSEKADDFLSIGDNIVKGIWQGISGGTEWIFNKISDWVRDVIEWIKQKLDINSPSGVAEREIGFWFARGVGTGWEKEMKNVNKLIADSINTSFDIPEISVRSRAFIGRNYATSSGKIVNLYFYTKSITESDINMIVDVVNRKLGEAM